jgi:hypothetical protein
MGRYNKATEMMLDLVRDDLDCHGIRYSAGAIGSDKAIEDFKKEVILDCGLSDEDIETKFANGYFDDALYTAAVQAFMAQVNWSYVHASYSVRQRKLHDGQGH